MLLIKMKRMLIATVLVLIFLLYAMPLEPQPTDVVTATVAPSWNTLKTSLPNGTSQVKAIALDGRIHVLGGAFHYQYDPETNTWIQLASMPTLRYSGFGLAAYNHKIYLIGGYLGYEYGPNDSVSSANEVYDPSTDSWESRAAMPNARDWVEANTVNGKIYVIGGDDTLYRRSHLNEVYDPVNDSWSTKQPAPIGMIKGASAVIDDKIYLLGGLGDNDSLNAISNQIYDTTTDCWSLGAPLPSTMWYTAACATSGAMAPKRIYIMGGGFTEISDTVSVYNPAANNWTASLPMPQTRMGHTIASIDDKIYVMGGSCSYQGPHPLGSPLTPGISWTPTAQVDVFTPLDYGTTDPSLIPQADEQSFPSIWVLTALAVVVFCLIALFYIRKTRKGAITS